MQANYHNPNTPFGQDVKIGLSSFPKFLSSKYFYNAEGSRIFQQIMELEEYYLTNCEYEILQMQKENILTTLPKSFDLVELGAGDGLKTKILLKYFLAQNVDFQYMPVDISLDILKVLHDSLAIEMPNLAVKILHDDYFGALKKISNLSEKPKVVLFLGANIGNFSVTEAAAFLKQLNNSLNKGDFLLLGVDLVKNPNVILQAYSDSKSVTANFNYNLLQRINDELGANFVIENFMHQATYNPETGETKSYLISKEKQTVEIKSLSLTIYFNAWESIYTEVSQKFSFSQIENIAKETGFEIQKHFLDSKKYFTDTLWKVI